jgi:hypothetical protein
VVVVFIAAHAALDFASRQEQYSLLYGTLCSLQSQNK